MCSQQVWRWRATKSKENLDQKDSKLVIAVAIPVYSLFKYTERSEVLVIFDRITGQVN